MLVIMIKQMYVVMLTPELLLCSIPEDCRMVPRVCSHCHLCTDLSLRPPLLPGTEEVPGHQTAGSRCSSPTCCSMGCTHLRYKDMMINDYNTSIIFLPTSQSLGVSQVRPWPSALVMMRDNATIDDNSIIIIIVVYIFVIMRVGENCAAGSDHRVSVVRKPGPAQLS